MFEKEASFCVANVDGRRRLSVPFYRLIDADQLAGRVGPEQQIMTFGNKLFVDVAWTELHIAEYISLAF